MRLVLFLLWLSCAPATARDWTDLEAFTATASTLQADARDGDTSAPVEIVLDARDVRIHEDGRRSSARHLVYVVRDADVLDRWSVIRIAWSPWDQTRPEVRARVVTPSGKVVAVDPTSLHAPEGSGARDRATTLTMPLPPLEPGAIVEIMASVTDLPGTSLALVSGSVPFQDLDAPVRRVRVHLHAPASATVRTAVHDLDPTAAQTAEGWLADGERHATYTFGPLPPVPAWRSTLPLDGAAQPSVHYALAGTWSEVAQAWDRVLTIDPDTSELAPLVESLRGLPADEALRRAVRGLQERVVVLPGQFGDTDPRPRTLHDLLLDGEGDPEDVAAAAVSLLRAANVPAVLSLVDRSARPGDVRPFPEARQMDAVLVHLPGTDVWADPRQTDGPVTFLQQDVAGRWALDVGLPDAPHLSTPLPPSVSATDLEIDLSQFGFPSIVQTLRSHGDKASAVRRALRAPQGEGSPSPIDQVAARWLGTREALQVTVTGEDADAPSLELRVRQDRALTGQSHPGGATAAIRVHELGTEVLALDPALLDRALEDTSAWVDPPRVSLARREERSTITVEVPAGFVATTPPADVTLDVPHAHLTTRWSTDDAGRIRVAATLTTDGMSLALGDAKALRTALDAPLFQQQGTTLVVSPAVASTPTGTVRNARAAWAAAGRAPLAAAAAVLQLTTLGLRDAGLRAADERITAAPDDLAMRSVRASLRATSTWGRLDGAPDDPGGALADLEQVVRRDPDNTRLLILPTTVCTTRPGLPTAPTGLDAPACATWLAQVQASTTSWMVPEIAARRDRLLADFGRWQDVLDAPSAGALSPGQLAPAFLARMSLRGLDDAFAWLDAVAPTAGRTVLGTVDRMLWDDEAYDPLASLLERVSTRGGYPPALGARLAMVRALRDAPLHAEADLTPFEGRATDRLRGVDATASRVDLRGLSPRGGLTDSLLAFVDRDADWDVGRGTRVVRRLRASRTAIVDLGHGLREVTVTGPVPSWSQGYWTTGTTRHRQVRATVTAPDALGVEILDRLARDDLAGAAAVADSLRRLSRTVAGAFAQLDDLVDTTHAEGAPPDRERLLRLGHTLAGASRPTSAAALPALLRGIDRGTAWAVGMHVAFAWPDGVPGRVAAIEAVRAVAPEEPSLLVLYLAVLGAEDPARVAAEADEVLASTGAEAWVREQLAEALVAGGHVDRAADLVLADCHAGTPASCPQAAWLLLWADRPADAIEVLRPLSEGGAPLDDTANRTLTGALAASGDLDAALTRWQAVVEGAHPPDPSWWVVGGLIYEALGEPGLARTCFERVPMTRGPDSPWAFARYRLGSLDRARP
ncbi:MAG: DUF3857 domain-containing protein [Alphaproteobacteria bacterium]|nr:DUF3857 domain-containing protein [Alphaproteobacteria bacterium]